MALGGVSLDRGLPLVTVPHPDGQRTTLAVTGDSGGSSVATTPKIYNLSLDNAGEEYSQLLSDLTKKLLIKNRTNTGSIYIAFAAGQTTVAYLTLPPGAVYNENNLGLSGISLYLRSDVAAQVVEILEWT